MDTRLKEICEKVLEINKTTKEYVAIFIDGRGTPIPRDMLYYIFKDGKGNDELYNLTRDDFLLCYNNDILEDDSYAGLHRRAIYVFKIDKIKELLNKEETNQ